MFLLDVAALLLLSASDVSGPVVGSGAIPHSTRYAAQAYTVQEGLPQSSVVSFAQDELGFLWVATFGGLARFDGSRFVRVEPQGIGDQHENRFTSVHTVGGALYAGTDRGRLFRLSGHSARPQQAHVDEVALGGLTLSAPVWGVAPFGDALYVAAGRRGLLRVNAQALHEPPAVVALPSGAGSHVAQLVATRSALWVRTPEAVTCVAGDCAGTVWPERDVTALVVDGAGELWRAGSGGVFRYVGGAWQPEPAPAGTAHLAFGENGRTRFAASADELFVTRSDGRPERVFLPARRATGARLDDTRPAIRSLFVDGNDNLWVGTDDSGMFLVRDRGVVQIGRQDGLHGDSVLLTLLQKNGDVLVSSYCHGLQRLRFRGDGRAQVERLGAVDHDACVSLLIDRGDRVWADVEGALVELSGPELLNRRELLPASPDDAFHAAVDDGRGGLWLGTRNRGLVHFNDGVIDRTVGAAEGLWSNDVRSLALDSDGAVLVGTARGASRVTDEGASPLLDDDAHRSAEIRDLWRDERGVVWLASYGAGLGRAPPPPSPGQRRTARWLRERDGLCDDTLSRILPGDGDDVWLNGNRGVARFDRAFLDQLAASAAQDGGGGDCRLYETGEGNGGGSPAGTRLADGRLLLPTIDGIAVVDPAVTAAPRAPASVVWEEATVGGTAIDDAGETVVDVEHRDLNARFASPSFAEVSPPRFEVALRGAGVDDVTTATAQSVRYVDLAPGHYTLSVRRRAAGQSGTAASLSFFIKPKLWETTAFRVGAPLALLLALVAGLRVWMRAVRGRARALESQLGARNQAEAARRERDAIYQTVFDGSPGPLWVHATDGRLVDLNRAARLLLGRPLAHIAEEPAYAFVDENSRALYRSLVEGALQGQRDAEGEVVTHGEGGKRNTIKVQCSSFALRGEPHVLVSAQDVTAERAAEAERTALSEQLETARRLESLGRLAGGIAHDFNNVLAALLTQAHLMRDANTKPDMVLELSGEMIDAVARARALTARLLVFGRESAGDQKEVEMHDAARRATGMLQRLMRKGVALRVDERSGVAPVRIDPVQLDQIVMNLVVNAQDAIDQKGGGRITITTGRGGDYDVRPGALDRTILPMPQGPVGLLIVDDTGSGMDAETLSRAFEPFFTTKPLGKGTGMGLAIVHGAVQKAGGGLIVRSLPGEGTRITVALPLAASTPRPQAPGKADVEGGALRALVCDDHELVRRGIVRALAARGIGTLEAEDGKMGLEMLRTNAVDLVITDLVMPEMNGTELITRLRAEGFTVPVLLVSGFLDNDSPELARLPADVGRLEKPFTPDVLYAAIDELLAAHGRARA